MPTPSTAARATTSIHADGDGAIDTIDCGDGDHDRAIVDPTDVVVGGCETIVIKTPPV